MDSTAEVFFFDHAIRDVPTPLVRAKFEDRKSAILALDLSVDRNIGIAMAIAGAGVFSFDHWQRARGMLQATNDVRVHCLSYLFPEKPADYAADLEETIYACWVFPQAEGVFLQTTLLQLAAFATITDESLLVEGSFEGFPMDKALRVWADIPDDGKTNEGGTREWRLPKLGPDVFFRIVQTGPKNCIVSWKGCDGKPLVPLRAEFLLV